jgi:hypothetical protein
VRFRGFEPPRRCVSGTSMWYIIKRSKGICDASRRDRWPHKTRVALTHSRLELFHTLVPPRDLFPSLALARRTHILAFTLAPALTLGTLINPHTPLCQLSPKRGFT